MNQKSATFSRSPPARDTTQLKRTLVQRTQQIVDGLDDHSLVVGVLEPRVRKDLGVQCVVYTDTAARSEAGGDVDCDGEDLRRVVRVVCGDECRARTSGALHIARLAIGSTESLPVVEFGARASENTSAIGSVLSGIRRAGAGPNRSPVIVLFSGCQQAYNVSTRGR